MAYDMVDEPPSHPSSASVAAEDTIFREMPDLVEAIPDGVMLVDASGRIQLVNHQAEVLFGFDREAVLGQPVEVLMPERFRPLHPAHRGDYAAEPHVRPMGSGLRLFGQRQDGSEFPVEISLSPITAAGAPMVLATIRDVTERHALEQQARAALEGRLAVLQAVLDELPTSVYLARGHNAELVLANRQVREVWGAVWHEGQPMDQFLAVGRARVYDLQGRELPLERLATVRALRDRQSVRQHREVIRRADGTTLSVLVNAVALDPRLLPYLSEVYTRPDDPIPLVLVVHQDVNALAEAEQLKDEFVALAAHELRNPVASLLGYTQLLLQATGSHGKPHTEPSGDVPISEQEDAADGSSQDKLVIPIEWQEEAVTAIIESSRRLAALTDDLLDATRLQADRLELRTEPLELGALVRRVVKRAQVTTRQHAIQVAMPSEPLVVEADAQRVEQVLTNLLSNAIKYSPDGGYIDVTVNRLPGAGRADNAAAAADEQSLPDDSTTRGTRADAGEHQAAPLARSADVARVVVRDHGMGIPADQQSRIFGRFGRADNARERGIAGTGLGLYLSRELIERQGGSIWFESSAGVGVGTTFTFDLPCWIEDPP